MLPVAKSALVPLGGVAARVETQKWESNWLLISVVTFDSLKRSRRQQQVELSLAALASLGPFAAALLTALGNPPLGTLVANELSVGHVLLRGGPRFPTTTVVSQI